MAPVTTLRPSCPALLLPLAAALLGVAGPARAADVHVRMSAPATSCADVETGVVACEVGGGEVFDAIWRLDSQQPLNGYDLEIRWDAGELTLVSATPLYPDTGTAVAFLEAPSDPESSSAIALSFVAQQTTALFSLRFEASPKAGPDGADLWWFANGNGLSPASAVLQNPEGGAWDLYDSTSPPSVPIHGGWIAAAAAGILGTLRLRLRPR